MLSTSSTRLFSRMSNNLLFYGDNLDVLRRHIEGESVDLVYLDPPFNSNANYNVLFAERDGRQAAAQIKAFEDTWRWDDEAARSFEEVVERVAVRKSTESVPSIARIREQSGFVEKCTERLIA